MNPLALNNRVIAITRPAGQATKLSKLVSDAGGRPVAYPLIAIAPLEDYSAFEDMLAQLHGYDWAIFISSNAVQNAMPRLLSKLHATPPNLKFAAIGPVTAAELKEFGITDVLTPTTRFDSEALLALPEMQETAGQRVLIFRGVGGREVLADTLKERGATVAFAESYRRINPQTDATTLTRLWQNKQLDAVVVTSSEAMRHLLELAGITQADKALPGNELPVWLHDVVLCVNHARIAEPALELGLKVAIAQAPGDDAMLQCLTTALDKR